MAFVIGLLVGVAVGFLIAALMTAADRSDGRF